MPLRASATQRLRIRGPKAARGTLTIRGGRITGRIGGRRVNVTARAAAVSSDAEPDWRMLLRRHRLRNAG